MRVFLSGFMLGLGLVSSIMGSTPPGGMTFERYQTELASVIQREKVAREAIAREQASIENLKQRITETDAAIGTVIHELYALLGITEEDVAAAGAELETIKDALERHLSRLPDELPGAEGEIEELGSRFSALKAKRVCLLYRIAAKVRQVEGLLMQARQRLQAARFPSAPPRDNTSSGYTVGRDGKARNLSHIAAEVYGDQYQWPRIYRANKRLIDTWYDRYKNSTGNPKIFRPQDFILPGWTLEIPR